MARPFANRTINLLRCAWIVAILLLSALATGCSSTPAEQQIKINLVGSTINYDKVVSADEIKDFSIRDVEIIDNDMYITTHFTMYSKIFKVNIDYKIRVHYMKLKDKWQYQDFAYLSVEKSG